MRYLPQPGHSNHSRVLTWSWGCSILVLQWSWPCISSKNDLKFWFSGSEQCQTVILNSKAADAQNNAPSPTMWEVYSELLAWSSSGLRTSMTTIIESEQHRIMTQNLCFLYYLYPTCPFLCLSTTLTILRVFLIVPCLDFEHAHMSLRTFSIDSGTKGAGVLTCSIPCSAYIRYLSNFC